MPLFSATGYCITQSVTVLLCRLLYHTAWEQKPLQSSVHLLLYSPLPFPMSSSPFPLRGARNVTQSISELILDWRFGGQPRPPNLRQRKGPDGTCWSLSSPHYCVPHKQHELIEVTPQRDTRWGCLAQGIAIIKTQHNRKPEDSKRRGLGPSPAASHTCHQHFRLCQPLMRKRKWPHESKGSCEFQPWPARIPCCYSTSHEAGG